MLRGALAVVTFLAGLIAGAGVMATATNAPAATAVPPTPTPAYARYSANAVAQAFSRAGLAADPPVPSAPGVFPEAPQLAVAFSLWEPNSASALPMMAVVITARPEELVPWQNYFIEHSRGPYLRFRFLIRHNAILVFKDVGSQNNPLPEYSRYWAVFAAMP